MSETSVVSETLQGDRLSLERDTVERDTLLERQRDTIGRRRESLSL